MQESEESRHDGRWRSIIQSAVDGIILIAARGRIETFNHAAERLFGYTETEMLDLHRRAPPGKHNLPLPKAIELESASGLRSSLVSAVRLPEIRQRQPFGRTP